MVYDKPVEENIITHLNSSNCSICTFSLEDCNGKCTICGSVSSHIWNYVNEIEGDTTYQTPYTKQLVERAKIIVAEQCEKIVNRTYSFLFCLIRPPGHHSCDDHRVGFCHYNFAIYALDILHNFDKNCVILDIDAHHGDGTEKEIVKRDYGYFISIHGYDENVYPKTGEFCNTERVMNIPLAKNTKDDEWFEKFHQYVSPEITSKYDYIILSCGFDGYEKDVIAPLSLSKEFYLKLSHILRSFNIPILGILEGGYTEEIGILSSNLLSGFM